MNEYPTPSTVPAQSQHIEAIKKSNKSKTKWALVCLIGPTALFVGSILLYAIVNFIFGGSPEADMSPIKTIVNVLLFLAGALTVATWLPGIIVGVVLLVTRKPVPVQ